MVITRRHRRAIAWVGVAALLLLQVSLAAHQFGHTVDDSFKYCRVCVQHHRLDAIAPAETAAVGPQAPAAQAEYFEPAMPSPAFVHAFDARAPPLS
jgi:hypothetical protein